MKNSRHLGKQLEWWGREVRSYLKPKNHQIYRKLRGQTNLVEHSEDAPLVVFDFHNIAIDNVGGRYLYHLVQDFLAHGYTPCYRDNFRFIANIEEKGFKRFLLDLPHIIFHSPKELAPYGQLDAIVSDSPAALAASPAKHKILVNYERRRAIAPEIPLTFGPSPALLRREVFSDDEPNFSDDRRNTIFFSGQTRPQEYGRDILRVEHDMMNRLEVISCVEDHGFPDATIPTTQPDPDEWDKPHSLLIVRNDVARIPLQRWMELMANSDFFLACPGSEMPMCHNLVEAIAAGSIPILEYPDYLHPGLTHEENCLAFHGPEELLEMIQRALNMSAAEKEQLKRNAYQFYLQHCQPSRLAKALLARPKSTLVMNDYRVKRRP